MWKRTWKKNSVPNKLRKRPTISFKSDLTQDEIGHIRNLKENKAGSKFINDSIKMRFMYERHNRAFLIEMIQRNYSLVKYLVRHIGETRDK